MALLGVLGHLSWVLTQYTLHPPQEAEASYQQAAQLAAQQAARQLTNATAVTLQAQLQAAQQAAQQAKEGQAKAEAEAAKHKGDLQRVREVSETQVSELCGGGGLGWRWVGVVDLRLCVCG